MEALKKYLVVVAFSSAIFDKTTAKPTHIFEPSYFPESKIWINTRCVRLPVSTSAFIQDKFLFSAFANQHFKPEAWKGIICAPVTGLASHLNSFKMQPNIWVASDANFYCFMVRSTAFISKFWPVDCSVIGRFPASEFLFEKQRTEKLHLM